MAHERGIRGEPVGDGDVSDVLDIPLVLQPWEPDYAVATYRDGGAEFPAPDLPDEWVEISPMTGAEQLDDDVDLALRQLPGNNASASRPWLRWPSESATRYRHAVPRCARLPRDAIRPLP